MAKIFIDPGHGGHDPGAIGKNSREKDNVLKVAKALKKILEDKGHTVKLSRSTDVYLTLKQRTDSANNWGADVFVSLHNNSAVNNTATGFETFIFNGKISSSTRTLQNNIHSEIMKLIGIRDRGKKRANFSVVRRSEMPAVLIEYAFINNPKDESVLINQVNKLATGTANGILRFLGNKTVSAKPQASKPAKKPAKKKPSKSKGPNMNTDSIVVYLNSINKPSDYDNRKKLARQKGISNYSGTAMQNTRLLNILRTGKSNTKPKTKPSNNKLTAPAPTLRRGSKGDRVRQLQRALNKVNFKVGKVDGIYGAKTEDAVRRFQKVYDAYNVDGIYGKRTQTRLNKKL